MNINDLLSNTPVVPLVQADDPAIAVDTSRALGNAAHAATGRRLHTLPLG